MRHWQFKTILSDEENIYKEFVVKDNSIGWQDELNDNIVIKALAKSKKEFVITCQNYLRLFQPNNSFNDFGICAKMTILEAYLRYGSNAIVEVLDYGSFNLANIENAKRD